MPDSSQTLTRSLSVWPVLCPPISEVGNHPQPAPCSARSSHPSPPPSWDAGDARRKPETLSPRLSVHMPFNSSPPVGEPFLVSQTRSDPLRWNLTKLCISPAHFTTAILHLFVWVFE